MLKIRMFASRMSLFMFIVVNLDYNSDKPKSPLLLISVTKEHPCILKHMLTERKRPFRGVTVKLRNRILQFSEITLIKYPKFSMMFWIFAFNACFEYDWRNYSNRVGCIMWMPLCIKRYKLYTLYHIYHITFKSFSSLFDNSKISPKIIVVYFSRQFY